MGHGGTASSANPGEYGAVGHAGGCERDVSRGHIPSRVDSVDIVDSGGGDMPYFVNIAQNPATYTLAPRPPDGRRAPTVSDNSWYSEYEGVT